VNGLDPLPATTPHRLIDAQHRALITALGIAGNRARSLFHMLATDALQGPFGHGASRFSAINADGVPFQWSVSVGSSAGGLRFLLDCGRTGMSISARIAYSLERLTLLSTTIPCARALPAVHQALDHLRPDAALLDQSLMGIWMAVGVTRGGDAGVKIYVNERVGDIAARYRRFGECLAAFSRWAAIERLCDVVRVVGVRACPVAAAFDVLPDGIGRLKLYFRAVDGAPALQQAVAEAAGCADAAERLALLHRAFLPAAAYPANAVVFSVEFPADGGEASFKVDLNTGMFLTTDIDVDRRIEHLCSLLDLPADEYQAVRDVVVPVPSRAAVAQIVFVGVALRRREHRINVYFHPIPPGRRWVDGASHDGSSSRYD
jgi:hypothetical protein